MTDFRGVFPVLQLIGYCTKDQCLDLRDRFCPRRAVRHCSPEGWDLGDPASIFFSFDFHLHARTVTSAECGIKRVLALAEKCCWDQLGSSFAG